MEKRTRERKAANLRWTEEAVNIVLDCMKSQPEKIEKPTAKIYYTKMIENYEELKIFTWEHIRNKVKNLKMKYKTAIDWRNQTGAHLIEQGDERSIKEYMLKMCSKFDELDEIFGSKLNVNVPFLMDMWEENTQASDSLKDEVPHNEEIYFQESSAMNAYEGDEEQEVTKETTASPLDKVMKRNAYQRNGSISHLADIYSAKTEYYKEKLFIENALENKKIKLEEEKLSIEREKLNLEKEKVKEEIRLKEIELTNKYKLEEMRIQLEMKLKAEELQLKYRVNQ